MSFSIVVPRKIIVVFVFSAALLALLVAGARWVSAGEGCDRVGDPGVRRPRLYAQPETSAPYLPRHKTRQRDGRSSWPGMFDNILGNGTISGR